MDQKTQDMFSTCLKDKSIVCSSKDSIKGKVGQKKTHEIEYSTAAMEDGMTLEFKTDQPHVCCVQQYVDGILKIKVTSPLTPCFMVVNILVYVETNDSDVMNPLEIMQIDMSFD